MYKLNNRFGLIQFSGAALLLIVAGIPFAVAAEDSYPSRPVRLIVGYQPGGVTDVLARTLAQRLTERWKQPVIVENRPGASETIAASAVANAKPDGYTLLVGSDVALQSNYFLFSKLPYSSTSFSPVIRIAFSPLVLVVRSTSPYQNIGQVIDAARKSPAKLTYASSSPGGQIHLALNWLAVRAGVEFTHVPYKGGAPAVQAAVAGEVDMTAVTYSTGASFIDAGVLRPLAVTSPKRLTVLPQVPSLSELGFEDVDVQILTAIVAPAHTPPEIVNKIANDVRDVIAEPTFMERQITKFGYVAVGDNPTEFADYLVRDANRHRARISAAHVKLD